MTMQHIRGCDNDDDDNSDADKANKKDTYVSGYLTESYLFSVSRIVVQYKQKQAQRRAAKETAETKTFQSEFCITFSA